MKYLVIDFLYRAGPVLLFIFILSLAAWYLILQAWIICRREEEAAEKFTAWMDPDDFSDHGKDTFLGRKIFLLQNIPCNKGGTEMEIFCRCYALETGKYLRTLKTLAGLAPLLGLLGTVAGMIKTFLVIRLFGGANPALMAEGISEALLTTQAGLVTAFPIIMFHALLKKRCSALLDRVMKFQFSIKET